MKGNYIRLGLMLFLFVCIQTLQYALDNSAPFLKYYIDHIFLPLQRGRNDIFNKVPLSIGDILYLLLFLLLLLIFIRLVYFAFTYKRNKPDLWTELLRFLTLPLVIYLAFLIFWGGNYSRKGLTQDWNFEKIPWETKNLVELNQFLIHNLNELEKDSTAINYPNLKELNKISNNLYHENFGNKIPKLKVKPTSLGYMLSYFGIHGYYNPLTGEAQYNKFILPFMYPFVISHEMAHQLGIAREDDANLMAYIIGVESNNKAYQYSAYFNLFLYSNGNLEEKDKETAEKLYETLNPKTKQDIEDLHEMYKKYRSVFRGLSNSMYDEYLILHGQEKGIDSYNDVSKWVYYWEKFNRKDKISIF